MRRAFLGLLTILSACIAGYIVEWDLPLPRSGSGSIGYSAPPLFDANGDSLPDVVVYSPDSVTLYDGASRQRFWAISRPSGYTYVSLWRLAQADADPSRELIYVAYRISAENVIFYRFYIRDCRTHALEFTSPEMSHYVGVMIGDIDGDGMEEMGCNTGDSLNARLKVYGWSGPGVDELPVSRPRVALPVASPVPSSGPIALAVPYAPPGTPVVIADASGRAIRTLVNPGSELVVWDARDANGLPAPPGVYFFTAGEVSGKLEVVR